MGNSGIAELPQLRDAKPKSVAVDGQRISVGIVSEYRVPELRCSRRGGESKPHSFKCGESELR